MRQRSREAEGGGEEGDMPERRCIATGEVKPAEQMIRFVVAPDGSIVPDLDARLPGRGLWITAGRDMIAAAKAKKAFAKAARTSVTVPDDLEDRIEALLMQRSLNLLGLAKRAGQAIAGFEKVREMLKAKGAALLLEASDAAADGRAKMESLARGLPVVDLFSRDELAAALGRENAVHVAVAPGGLAQRLLVETGRLSGFRKGAEARSGMSGDGGPDAGPAPSRSDG